MAKKKPASSTGAKSTNGANSKTSAKSNGRQPAASLKSAAKEATSSATAVAQGEMSTEQIGQVAGQVWHELAETDGQSLAALKKSIDAPGDLVAAALGWLAREGKLEFATSGRTLKISLR